ncbi:MAG: porin, partial [Pseudomonadales bacterium]|nr:porin [Pseudomonadales bacterium]
MKSIFASTVRNAVALPGAMALLIYSVLFATDVQAQTRTDSMAFYGRANLSLQRTDLEDGSGAQVQDNWELRSNTSVVGIRGSHGLQEDLRAVFQLEYEVFIDDGDDGNGDDSEFNQRNSYLGVEGSWGRVIAGKHDTPLKMAQGKVDRFNDLLLGDLRFAIQGENRPDNIVVYRSPLRDNWRFRAAFVPGEDNGTTDTAHDDLGNAISASAEHTQGKHRFAIAHERGDVIDTAVDYATRFVFEHAEQQFSLGLLLQHAE